MWLRINKIHKKYEIAYHNYAEAESARIKCKIVYANPHTIKTVIYNDIFTSLWRKKVQSPAK